IIFFIFLVLSCQKKACRRLTSLLSGTAYISVLIPHVWRYPELDHPYRYYSYYHRPDPLGRGHLQPVPVPKKLVRGDPWSDQGRYEEAPGHDRPAARSGKELCQVRAGDVYQGHCDAGKRCNPGPGDLNKVEAE